MRTARRRTLPLPFLFALALLLFTAGLGTGWSGASAYETHTASARLFSADPVLAAAALPALQPTVPPSDKPSPAPPAKDSWNLILVNFENPLPDSFTVPGLTQLRSGQAVDSRIYPALQQMMDDARAAGLQPVICSSYRSRDTQTQLYETEIQNWLDRGYGQEDAEAQAAMWVARPDTSEHQTGLAVDIVDLSYQLLNEGQENTPVQQWLMAHCAEYGFILRYPTDKSALTGVGYEPWHYRYVGAEAAQEIMEGGLCLEGYLLN